MSFFGNVVKFGLSILTVTI